MEKHPEPDRLSPNQLSNDELSEVAGGLEFTLREGYVDNTRDLAGFADKIETMNSKKKELRDWD